MSNVNDFLPFCATDTGTNLLTESEYTASADRTSGNKPGVASSKLNNKAIRQANAIASQIAQFTSNKLAVDVLDDANYTNLLAQLVRAFNGQSLASKTTTFTADINTQLYLCSTAGGSYTATLPTAVGNSGLTITFKKTTNDFSGLTIDGNASETIDGALTFVLYTQYESLTIVSDGANWNISEHKCNTSLVAYTPTFTGFGTVTSINFFWQRLADSIWIQGYATAGTTTATEGRVTLPSSLTSDATKVPAIFGVGEWGDANPPTAPGFVLIESNVNYVTFGSGAVGQNSFGKLNGSAVAGTSDKFSLFAKIPITGWSA